MIISYIKEVINKMDQNITVNVRWWDGYLEEFEATEVRFGCDLLWMHLSNGRNRHIPLRHVRWFGLDPESHEKITREVNSDYSCQLGELP